MPVRISKRKNGYQYYLQKDDGKLEYIKEKDLDRVKKIVQRDYYNTLLDKLLTVRYRIDRFIKIYDIDSIQMAYDGLSEARKALVKPLILSDEDFIIKWRDENIGGLNPFPEEGEYVTLKGERVRSKSEKILADLFEKHEIPYIYEPQIKIDSEKKLYPDFALLNVRTRKTVYWEHFGLISDGEYAKNALSKLNLYEQVGVEVGNNLIITMESGKSPLNIKLIMEKIRRHLL